MFASGKCFSKLHNWLWKNNTAATFSKTFSFPMLGADCIFCFEITWFLALLAIVSLTFTCTSKE